MTKSFHFIAAALAMAFAAATAFAQAQPIAEERAPPACEGQRFIFMAGDSPHVTRVTLCSKKDATPDDLVKMLDSAAAALSTNLKLAPEKRVDLIAQIKSKADGLRPAPAAAGPVVSARAGAIAGLSLPKPAISAEPPSDYTKLPPLPPPLPAATASVVDASPSLPTLARPRLTIECLNLEDLGGAGPCSVIERQTRLVVRADEAVPAQTALRFLRRGDMRAELELAQLSRGQSIRLALPTELCSGVNNSRVEIQVVRRAGTHSAAQVVDSLGPYLLHC